jgi:hypothetical protein
LSGNGAYEGEMNDVAMFENSLRVAVPTRPDPTLGRDLVPRLAQAARASMLEAESRAHRGTPRSRFALVARIGIAVALIPLVLAGLAFAGVTVPSPARSAFDSLGITLPNQPAQENASSKSVTSTTTTGNDVSSAAKDASHRQKGGNSAAAHRHALQQRLKARGRAIGHSRGKAVGLTGSTPPAQSTLTTPPTSSNAGGASSTHAAPTSTTHGPPSRHIPGGNAAGHSK